MTKTPPKPGRPRGYRADALDVLAQMARDTRLDPSVRIEAAVELLAEAHRRSPPKVLQ